MSEFHVAHNHHDTDRLLDGSNEMPDLSVCANSLSLAGPCPKSVCLNLQTMFEKNYPLGLPMITSNCDMELTPTG